MLGRTARVIGALVGSVVGDALGAPFEFGPPGEFSGRFPPDVRNEPTEMCGGRGWQPGEWTDDTQMALIVADSLVEHRRVVEPDIYQRFVRWLRSDPGRRWCANPRGLVLAVRLGTPRRSISPRAIERPAMGR